MDPYTDAVREFHVKHGAHIARRVGLPPPDVAALAARLIREEAAETVEAMAAGDLVLVADGLADLEYVLRGAVLRYGLPFREVFREVHRSNMTKDAARTPQGAKVVKGPSFVPPDLSWLADLAKEPGTFR